VENVIPLKEQAQDTYCSDRFKETRFPRGFVTVYGSSRIKEKNERCLTPGCDNGLADANDRLYANVRAFANLWTERHGKTYPIMTGAGPGLMEAGSRGAKEGAGNSIGYTTYYDPSSSATPTMPYGGDPSTAFNAYVTEGLIFSSVAVRESAMIKHSAAIVLAPGGTGTEWEIFQILETIKSRQLAKVGVYIFGDRAYHWASMDQRLQDMVRRKTVRPEEIAFIKFVDSPAQLVEQIAADLNVK
jgi:predicted Rossmann-fold nucleotide-binding protein